MFKFLSKTSLILVLSILGIFSLISSIWFFISTRNNLTHKNDLIYVVNIQKIWEDLPATKQIQEDLQKILETYHQQLSKIETELKAEHQSLLSAQKNHMPAQELQTLEKRKHAFEAKVEHTQKDVESKQNSINKRHTMAMEKLRTIIHEQVKVVATQEGIAVILSAQQVIYSTNNQDLTAKIFEKVKAATADFHME